jgi:hypothetical protein
MPLSTTIAQDTSSPFHFHTSRRHGYFVPMEADPSGGPKILMDLHTPICHQPKSSWWSSAVAVEDQVASRGLDPIAELC